MERRMKRNGCNPEESAYSRPYIFLPSHKYPESFLFFKECGTSNPNATCKLGRFVPFGVTNGPTEAWICSGFVLCHVKSAIQVYSCCDTLSSGTLWTSYKQNICIIGVVQFELWCVSSLSLYSNKLEVEFNQSICNVKGKCWLSHSSSPIKTLLALHNGTKTTVYSPRVSFRWHQWKTASGCSSPGGLNTHL